MPIPARPGRPAGSGQTPLYSRRFPYRIRPERTRARRRFPGATAPIWSRPEVPASNSRGRPTMRRIPWMHPMAATPRLSLTS